MMVGFKYQRAILEDHREESLHEGSGGCVGVGNCLDCANCMVEEWYHPGWGTRRHKIGDSKRTASVSSLFALDGGSVQLLKATA